MEIREAIPEDAQDILHLYLEVMGYEYPLHKIEEMIRVVKKDACNYVFVAVDAEEIKGIIEVVIKYSIHKPSYLIINTLAVDASCQGKGIGNALLSYTRDFAKAKGLAAISVGSQFKRCDAHSFYRKNGFKLIKEHKIFEEIL